MTCTDSAATTLSDVESLSQLAVTLNLGFGVAASFAERLLVGADEAVNKLSEAIERASAQIDALRQSDRKKATEIIMKVDKVRGETKRHRLVLSYFTGFFALGSFTVLSLLALSLLVYSTIYAKQCAPWWLILVGATLCLLPFGSVGSYFFLHFATRNTNKKCTRIEDELVHVFRDGITA